MDLLTKNLVTILSLRLLYSLLLEHDVYDPKDLKILTNDIAK